MVAELGGVVDFIAFEAIEEKENLRIEEGIGGWWWWSRDEKFGNVLCHIYFLLCCQGWHNNATTILISTTGSESPKPARPRELATT